MGSPNNIKDAEGFYESFIATLKWAVPLIAAITFFVVLLIS